MTSRLLLIVALVAPAAASSVLRLHAIRGGQGESGSMPDPHDNIEPLDFGAALAAAKAAKESGLDADASAEAAAAVLGGAQRERTPLPSLHPGAGLIDGWLATGDARLLQHEIVTADGWEVTEDAGGSSSRARRCRRGRSSSPRRSPRSTRTRGRPRGRRSTAASPGSRARRRRRRARGRRS